MIHKQIEELLPYISENLITYPLWEEGKYIPFINFWQIAETEKDFLEMNARIDKIALENIGYEIIYQNNNTVGSIHYFSINPIFYSEHLTIGYSYKKSDWSIEEMLDIILKIVKK